MNADEWTSEWNEAQRKTPHRPKHRPNSLPAATASTLLFARFMVKVCHGSAMQGNCQPVTYWHYSFLCVVWYIWNFRQALFALNHRHHTGVILTRISSEFIFLVCWRCFSLVVATSTFHIHSSSMLSTLSSFMLCLSLFSVVRFVCSLTHSLPLLLLLFFLLFYGFSQKVKTFECYGLCFMYLCFITSIFLVTFFCCFIFFIFKIFFGFFSDFFMFQFWFCSLLSLFCPIFPGHFTDSVGHIVMSALSHNCVGEWGSVWRCVCVGLRVCLENPIKKQNTKKEQQTADSTFHFIRFDGNKTKRTKRFQQQQQQQQQHNEEKTGKKIQKQQNKLQELRKATSDESRARVQKKWF